jgi:hypothetical protein
MSQRLKLQPPAATSALYCQERPADVEHTQHVRLLACRHQEQSTYECKQYVAAAAVLPTGCRLHI